jgi:L-methionine (R)-S-oxide reductase
MNTYAEVTTECLKIINSENLITYKMQQLCNLLDTRLENYDWTGFYTADVEKKTLLLGPYKGAPTSHTSIPFGKGICGQAAESKKTFLIDNVEEQSNYIACSIHVKSEIVVPIIKDGIVVAQIDVDSHIPAAFSKKDQELLESICTELAPYF